MAAVTKDMALRVYLALRAERSLKAVHENLIDQGLDPPALITIERWSKAGAWPDKAHQRDAEIGERVLQATTTEEAVAEVLAGAKRLRGSASKLIDMVEAALPTLAVERVVDIETVMSTVLAVIREARVEEGGVSDRTEAVGKAPGDLEAYTADLKERFRHLGPKPETPAPAPTVTSRPVETAPEPEAEHTPTELVPEGDDDEPTPSVRH